MLENLHEIVGAKEHSCSYFAVFCVYKKNKRIYQEKLFVWPSGKLFKAS